MKGMHIAKNNDINPIDSFVVNLFIWVTLGIMLNNFVKKLKYKE